jgi:parvulin-like peptidyl-prolyl isomerase
MKKKIKKILNRKKSTPDAPKSGPITNETVAAHREEVLGSARKYIYPLQHSKHRIVMISTALIIAAAVIFLSYSVAALYRFETTSSFMYRVTQVVPFPIAKTGSRFVAYENYLFELRHYIYFYENQQKLDFNSEAGQQQLAEYKKRAIDKVVNDAYVKELAKQNNVSVSNTEVEDQITLLRRQNRLGGSEQAYEEALKQNFGWSVDDFRRVIKQRLLEQKVIAAIDTDTQARADKALALITNGSKFEDVARQYSEDEVSKARGGTFGFAIDRSNRDINAQTTDALFRLNAGETSGIINTGYSLEIVKTISKNEDKVEGAHIVFNFKNLENYINDLKDKQAARVYISVN